MTHGISTCPRPRGWGAVGAHGRRVTNGQFHEFLGRRPAASTPMPVASPAVSAAPKVQPCDPYGLTQCGMLNNNLMRPSSFNTVKNLSGVR